MNVNQSNALKTLVSMVVFAFPWVMVFSAIVLLVSLVAGVRLTLTSVPRNLVTTMAAVLICLKGIVASVLQDTVASTAKKKNLIAAMTPALKEPCARTNLV
jgi:hypothetical protein